MGEIIFLLVLISISGLSLWQTGHFPKSLFEKSGGAALFPRVTLCALIIFCVIRIVIILAKKENRRFFFLEMFRSTRGVFLVASLLLVVVMPSLGYIISTTLFLLFMTNYLYLKKYDTFGDTKSIIVRNAVMIGISILMYVFFAKVMTVALPKGLLGF